jgi:hypothetical protein
MTTRRAPKFVTWIVARFEPASMRWDGEAVNAIAGRVVLVPAAVGTSTKQRTAAAAAALIDR